MSGVQYRIFPRIDTLINKQAKYQKVNGIGRKDSKGIRKKNKMNRYKQGVAYHKDYAIKHETGIVYGHLAIIHMECTLTLILNVWMEKQ